MILPGYVKINVIFKGMTEAGGAILHTKFRSKHIDAAGIVVPNCQVKFINRNSGETLGPHKEGELCAKAPSFMIGYYKNPDETNEALDGEGTNLLYQS